MPHVEALPAIPPSTPYFLLDFTNLYRHMAERFLGHPRYNHFALNFLRSTTLQAEPAPNVLRLPPTPARNEPCPCGSGKKYKHCHGLHPSPPSL